MNIVIVTQDYKPRLGGVSTVSFELAKALASIPEVNVKLLAPASGNLEKDKEFDCHGYFETKRCSVSKNNILSGVQWMFHLFQIQRSWNPTVFLNVLWLPCSLSCYLGMTFSILRKIPYFTIVHGVEVVESDRTFLKRMRKAAFKIKENVLRSSCIVFSVSEFTKKLIVKNCGVLEDRVSVVYNGVDVQSFVPTEVSLPLRQHWQSENRFVFLTICRLEDYKGIDCAIRAIKRVSLQHPHVLYIVGGEGPDQNRLMAITKRYEVEKNVKFLGAVPEKVLRELYHLSDVFVLMAREDWLAPNFEGFGLVLLEAASCGKPSIAGKSGGIPEVVVDGKTGWVVPPENEDEIVHAMLQSIENHRVRAKYGKMARERVIQEFSWQKMAVRILEEMKLHVRD